MKHIRKAGAVLFMTALAVGQTFGHVNAQVSTVDAEELFHSKQLIEELNEQNKLNTSQAEDVRAIPVERARIHWDAIDKAAAIPAQENVQPVPKAVPVIITAADIDAEKKQKKVKTETGREIIPVHPQQPATMTTLQQTESQQKKMIPKETVAAVVMEKQKETLELPPIQPIPMAEKVTRAAVEVPRIVEMPPIEQISTTVAIPPLESPEQPVELPPVRPVQ